MNSKYLPSKQFIWSVTIIVVGISFIFGIYKLVSYIRHRNGGAAPTKLVVRNIVQKDSNDNGIPDWEETLWGLDPSKDGVANKEFIVGERAKLAKNSTLVNGPTFDKSTETAENIELSREFFSVIMSLQQSGNLDDQSIQAVSETLGQKITATPIPDTYTRAMLTLQTTSQNSTDTYVKAVGALMNKYKGKDMGDELNLISQGLMRNDPQATALASGIAKSYKSFAQELVKIPVPYSLADLDLTLINDYDKVGQSIDGLTQILTNPITGMKALINYKKYSDTLVVDIQNLSDNY